MSKKKLILIAVITVGLLVILWLPFRWNHRRSTVHVMVKNESGVTIDTLVLKHDDGEIKYSALSDSDETELCFTNAGESSYTILAFLNNGAVLETRGMYVESGYSTRERIKSDTIISEYPRY